MTTTDPDRLHEDGLALLEAGRLDEALDHIGRALDLAAAEEAPKTAQPVQQTAIPALKTAQLQNSFGVVLAEMGQHGAAASSFRIALALAPAEARAWSNLGNAAASAPAHLRALALDPFAAGAYGNLATLRQSAGARSEAERLWRRALVLAPAIAVAWTNLGTLGMLRPLAEFDRAATAFDRAIAADPGFADGWLNRGLLRLLRGDYAKGLADYEWRWKRRGMVRPRLVLPAWTGEDPKGKRLLVWAEQGHGDTLHFIRFIPRLTARGAEVTLAAPRRLVPLLASFAGVETVVPIEDPLPAADLQAPLMSLPHLLGLGEAMAAPVAPYLAPPRRSAPIAGDGRPLIGLTWAGSPVNLSNATRSLSLDRLGPLLAPEGLRFVSLQFGVGAADVAAAGLEGRLETLEDLGDFADTAALVASLDLVVTVDTAMAHLAGAMGQEAWVMLAHVPDWRWGMSGETTPWYPSLRLFRQESPGDWDGVVRRIARALAARFASRSGPGAG